MKKAKQILALIGVVLLVGLYAMTIVFALTDNPATFHLLGTSIVASVVIPVIIWLVTFFFKMNKRDDDTEENRNSRS